MIFSKVFPAIIALFFIFSCARPDSGNTSTTDTPGVTDKEIIIGTSAALSGTAFFLGNQITKGSLCLINKINEGGGIYGRRLRMIVYDDKYDPETTRTHTARLINQDKAFVLFDYVGTPTAKVIIRDINESKIPVIGLFTGAEFLRNPFQPYVVNIRASYIFETETMIDYWLEHSKTKFGVYLQDDSFGTSVFQATQLALARHKKEITVTAKFKKGEMPNLKVVKKFAESSPDAIIMVGTAKPLAGFVRMARENGLQTSEFYTVSFVGSEAFAKELVEMGAAAGEKVYVTQVVPSPYDKENRVTAEFIALYRKYYPDDSPNYVALEGYINAKILIEALRRCGRDLDRNKLIKNIEKMSDYDAGTGLKSFISPVSHNFFEEVFISKLINNRFEILSK